MDDTNVNTQPNNAATAETSGQGERTFTQDDVNRIVSDRLAREREKLTKAEPDEKEQALKAREARLDCREYLNGKQYPAALLDILDTTDKDRVCGIVDALAKEFPLMLAKVRGADTPKPPVIMSESIDSRIAEAFKPKI
ncbi:hypothetical protein KQI82_01870 [Oscillibacter sp. MSJ-2]|uniref:DUF4355 domain-containing protein n=1 Tax=Dysosmobacter acutus TaxID=2841504 RepID=A0ABS6F5V8_9FIRM|nr:hypothetical protein [Dysosmobacter acutus]MBU5625682.1 hypothetical protein [Dysosmobacter acutus]